MQVCAKESRLLFSGQSWNNLSVDYMLKVIRVLCGSFSQFLVLQGFRKVDPDRWEFANEGFLRGRRDMLRGIHRRKPATHTAQQQQGVVEVGKFGLEGEIERLKRDKQVLMLELVRLRQLLQNTERELQVLKSLMYELVKPAESRFLELFICCSLRSGLESHCKALVQLAEMLWLCFLRTACKLLCTSIFFISLYDFHR